MKIRSIPGSVITTHSAIIKKLHFSLFKKWPQNVELYVKCRMPDDASEGNVHLKNIPLLAGKSYKPAPDASSCGFQHELGRHLPNSKGILESVVYYTVIDKIATNITERTFALWCRDVRNIVTAEDLDCFVKKHYYSHGE